ncbi:hypothetical protein L1987_75634 [Smallanthus sonchifolius]|uniref:Uncharacterized protein n=1 Tax=Smallanthus sonchifolius TaxID=185202 RepID=A0ACB9A5A5_9ASTR|nr:hypothetical protein L1987_75634 [Smallanthus sonchifolius]
MADTTNIFTPAFTFLLLCIVYAFLWMSLCFDHSLPPLGIDLQHYASVYNVTLVPSVLIPKKWHTKIQVCFHRNSSLGLCQCEKDDWRSLQNGLWVSTMSPYDHKFVDVKFGGMVTGSVTITLEEVQQRWRYILLAVGIVLLFLAPIVSEWVPFYYASSKQRWRYILLAVGIVLLFLAPIVSEWVPFYYASSMVIGIITVVLIILYQARILLPTGRRNSFYLAIVCSVVYYFVGLGIILLGAALGYWLLRKFFISEDGEVYFGVAQFVKWSMLIVASTCIFLSPKDNPLAMVAVGSCLALYHVIAKTKWCYHKARSYSGNRNLWARSKQTTPKHGRAEFLSCSKNTSPLNGMKNSFRWSNTLEEEWEEFTEESTRQSVAELAGSPEFTDWVIKNSGRIKFLPEDSLDDLDGSESSSTNEYVQQNGNGPGFFNWFMCK